MRNVIIAMACLAVLPASAAAAGTDPQGTKPGETKPTVIVEKVENGVAVGPDVKYTQINGHDGVLVGGIGGVLVDNRLFLGGAGYWLANGDWDRGLSYGGLVVEWHLFGSRTVNMSVGGLVGGGWGTASYTWSPMPSVDPHPTPGHAHDGYHSPAYGAGALEAGLFVAEPQVNVVWHAANWVTVTVGAGYRAVAGAGDFNEQFRGPSGSVSVRFGTPSK